jgi:hypothetical protein
MRLPVVPPGQLADVDRPTTKSARGSTGSPCATDDTGQLVQLVPRPGPPRPLPKPLPRPPRDPARLLGVLAPGSTAPSRLSLPWVNWSILPPIPALGQLAEWPTLIVPRPSPHTGQLAHRHRGGEPPENNFVSRGHGRGGASGGRWATGGGPGDTGDRPSRAPKSTQGSTSPRLLARRTGSTSPVVPLGGRP